MARMSIAVCHSATRSSLGGSSAQPGRYAPAAPRNFRSALLRRLFSHEISSARPIPKLHSGHRAQRRLRYQNDAPIQLPRSGTGHARYQDRNQGIAHHQIPHRPAQLHRTPSASAPAGNQVAPSVDANHRWRRHQRHQRWPTKVHFGQPILRVRRIKPAKKKAK